MTRRFTRLGLTAVALVAGSGIVAHAQTATTGLFTGKVTDQSGAAVVGAQVFLSGPSLQGVRTAVTGSDGGYRFAMIAAGRDYTLKVVSPSGGSQATGLTLDPWKTLTQNFTIKKAEQAGQTVEVIAAVQALGVDNTTTTDSKTYSTENLQTIPLAGRDYSSAAYLAPGVVDGGRGTSNPNIAGGTAFENNYVVDGMNVTDPQYGTNNTRINTLAIETVQVQSGGFEPEYGRATGGVISVVTKTGSNDFHVDVETTFRPKSMIAAASAQGALPFYSSRSAQGDQATYALWIGGPIIKDKLWYSFGVSGDDSTLERTYGAVQYLDPDLANYSPMAGPISSTQAYGLHNTGTHYSLKTKNLDMVGKLTFAINANNKLEFSATRNRDKNDNNTVGMTFNEYQDVTVQHSDVDILNLNWTATLTPSWLLDVRAGTYKRDVYNDLSAQGAMPYVGFASAAAYNSGQWLADGSGLANPGYNMRTTPNAQMGGWLSAGADELKRQQFTAKGTNFVGDHIIKYGVDYDETKFKSTSGYTGDFYVTRYGSANPNTGVPATTTDRFRFRTGVGGVAIKNAAGTVVANNVLVNGSLLTLDSKTQNLAYFIQDSWQVHPRLLVIAGFRVDSQKLYGGDGTEYLKFSGSDMTAPRLGITWDPWGDGKTKIQGNFGRFYETVPMDLNQRAGSVEGFAYFQQTFASSAAPTQLYSIPTLSRLFNTSTWTMQPAGATPGVNAMALRYTVGGERAAIDPSIKPQSIEEIGFGVERQVSSLVKLSAKWKYRYYKKVIEDFSFDFGTNYVLGNPGQNGLGLDPATVQEYDYPGQNVQLYFPKPRRDYRELTLGVDKAKGGDAWTLSGTLTFAINEGNFAGLDSPLNGQSDPNITSTYDLPTLMRNTYGILPNSPRYNLQINGTYDLGYGLTLGARWQYRAGTAISALGPDMGYLYGPANADATGYADYYTFNGQFLHVGNYGNNEALVEQRGSRGVTPDVSRFDIHIEWAKNLNLARKMKVTVFGDIFNFFNQQMPMTVDQTKETMTLVEGVQSNAQGQVLDPTNTALGYVSIQNPRFLKPTSYQAPRNFQFGVRLNF